MASTVQTIITKAWSRTKTLKFCPNVCEIYVIYWWQVNIDLETGFVSNTDKLWSSVLMNMLIYATVVEKELSKTRYNNRVHYHVWQSKWNWWINKISLYQITSAVRIVQVIIQRNPVRNSNDSYPRCRRKPRPGFLRKSRRPSQHVILRRGHSGYQERSVPCVESSLKCPCPHLAVTSEGRHLLGTFLGRSYDTWHWSAVLVPELPRWNVGNSCERHPGGTGKPPTCCSWRAVGIGCDLWWWKAAACILLTFSAGSSALWWPHDWQQTPSQPWQEAAGKHARSCPWDCKRRRVWTSWCSQWSYLLPRRRIQSPEERQMKGHFIFV